MAAALAGLSVAANVLQLISFCHDTIDLAIKIHKQGTVDHELSQNAKRIGSITEQLDSSIRNTIQMVSSVSLAQQELFDIAKDCSQAAKALKQKLDEISNSRGGVVVKTMKTFRYKRTLERFEESTRKYQQILDTRLLVELL
jgi:hypothetical protein